MPESIGCASVGFVRAVAEAHLAVPQGVRLPASDAGLLVRFVFCHPWPVPPRFSAMAFLAALGVSVLGCRTKARSCEVALEGLATLTRDVDAVVAIEPKTPRLKSPDDAAQFGAVAARLEAIAPTVNELSSRVEDPGVAKRVRAYGAAVEAWARASRAAEKACAAGTSQELSTAMGEEAHQSAEITRILADVNLACDAR